MDFWDFDIHTTKMNKTFWCNLLARRKQHMNTTVICAETQKEGIDMYNTPTLEATEIIQKLQEGLKQQYRDDRARRDKYLLSKENLESDAGEEEKSNVTRNIKQGKHCNQCYCNFNFTKELVSYHITSHHIK